MERGVDLEVVIAGLKLANPLMPAAGPLTGAPKAAARVAAAGVGGIVAKTISVQAAQVPRPNIARLPCGLLNCELWSEEPPERWMEEYLPAFRALGKPLIVSVGYRPEEVEELLPELSPFADAFELSSHYLGADPRPLYEIARAAKGVTDKPVFVKLSPHVPDISEFARAAVDGGADGIVAINSLGPGLAIDIRRRRPLLGGEHGYGWLSGPAIKPIALRAVYEVFQTVDVPVIGVGGIHTAEDVVEFFLAGASAVQLLSAAILEGVKVFRGILEGLPGLLSELGVVRLADLTGAAHG
jgi:dihydroorotate dehydrogenase subfamily 1